MSMFENHKKKLSAVFVGLVLSFSCGFAADGSSDTDSVAKFKQWLQDRDQKEQASLQQSSGEHPTAAAQSTTSNTVAPTSQQEQSSQNSSDDAVSQAAFQALVKQTMPMSPDQIVQYKKLVQKTQMASATYPGAPPKPVSSTLVVNLSPGSTPPAVRMYQGFITSLVFVDSSGATWPVEAYDLGNSKAFNIQWDRKSNVLMIQPQASYTFANLAVKLKGLTTPVMLTLVPGQAYVDYRVDLRINGFGPNAKQTSQSGLPANADATLISVLDGIPPSGATQLTVSGGAAQAWLSGNTMYVRTRFTLLSPAWLNMMTSPDGMHAYKLQKTPSVLISQYGKPVALRIKGV